MITIHRKLICCTFPAGVLLRPGMNNISDAEYSKVKDDKGFKEEVKLGLMYVGGHTETETSEAVEKNNIANKAPNMAEELRSLSVAKLKEILPKMIEAEKIKALMKIDGRTGVQEACEERLAEIKAQVGDDLTPESVPAPEGDGSDFADKIKTDKNSLKGKVPLSSIPALDANGGPLKEESQNNEEDF